MTERLYYIDSHILQFDSKVLACFPMKERVAAVLSRTAFFPEGGGQAADTGYIGNTRVTDVREVSVSEIPEEIVNQFPEELFCSVPGKAILHFVDEPIAAGEEVHCMLDEEQRLRRMQNHSGEHIVSGLVHKEYGYENVGFHMSVGFMTIDFSGELSREQLSSIEKKANEAVRKNLEIVQMFPESSELAEIEYRSKLELTENVRLVMIPGIDICACCAPHVKRTGEIGIIKLLTMERHRGGVRITLTCGMDALDDYRLRQQSVTEISEMLSAKRGEISSAVERLLSERDDYKEKLAEAENRLVKMRAESFGMTKGNICLFEDIAGEVSRRELVNLLMEKCSGMAAVFCGDDERGYHYVIGSKHCDLRKISREINAAISGRGGGRSEMIMGSASGKMDEIIAFFKQEI